MNDKIQAIQSEIEAFVIADSAALEQFRIQFVGRKGRLAELFDGLKDFAADSRREVGQALNGLKKPC